MWVIFWAPAKLNKQNGQPKKFVFILIQLPALAWVCFLPKSQRLHWSHQIPTKEICCLSYFSTISCTAWACFLPETYLLHWSLQIDCYLFSRWHWPMVTMKNSSCAARFRSLFHLVSRDSLTNLCTRQNAIPPSSVVRASRQGALGRRATLSNM